jgi:radical SAM superfamily enzyme YgiQ (UPF0313 family)
MIDLVVVSMPIVEIIGPTPGIYYIKGSAEKIGKTSVAKDLNVWFQQRQINLPAITNYFMQSKVELLDSNNPSHIETTEQFGIYIKENYEVFANSKYIGISLFSVYTIFPGIIFAELITKEFPNAILIVGGNGTEDSAPGGFDIGQYFIKQGLAKYAVYGEGEEAIQAILQNEPHPNVNSQKQKVSIDNLNLIAYPNYDDFFKEFPEYTTNIKLAIPIVGSRGCVRKCTFCNVPYIWPTYRFRSGENIANEMILNYKKYGINTYQFSDSLINGSMQAFRDLTKVMSQYHEENPEDYISWGGQFICRSRRQMLQQDFIDMKSGGCDYVSIGVESGSEKVRNDIHKGFTEDDMIYTIQSLLDNGIFVSLMFIIGYPTETDEDFDKTIALVERFAPYKDIMNVKVGKTLRMLDNTPLVNQFSHLYHYDDNKYPEWVSNVVPDLTFEKRVSRAVRLKTRLTELGYEIVNLHDDENFFEDKLKKRET